MAVGVSSLGRDTGFPCVLELAEWLSGMFAALFGNVLFRAGLRRRELN
jgi:hypothetical protein